MIDAPGMQLAVYCGDPANRHGPYRDYKSAVFRISPQLGIFESGNLCPDPSDSNDSVTTGLGLAAF